MIDAPVRRALTRPLGGIARAIDVPWVTPDRLTVAGLALGLASAVLAALGLWPAALATWLVSRLLDGLDGTLARRRRAMASAPGASAAVAGAAESGAASSSEAGGFLDIAADFIVYGASVAGVAVGSVTGFGAAWWPFMLVLLAYYVNGAAFLAFSSIAERTGRTLDDGRSLSFLGRIAEGTETIVVHSVWLLLPVAAWQVALGWAAFVAVSAVQRVVAGYRLLL